MSTGSKKPSLKVNFVYTILFRISGIIIPLITTPYISRVLGAEKTGIYAYTFTIAWYFVILGLFGFENYGNRQIAMVKDDIGKLNHTFSSLFGLQLITGSIATVAYISYMLLFCNKFHTEAWISGLYVLSVFANISWLFYGLEMFKKTTLRTIATRFSALILILLFVKTQDDLWKYVTILAFSEVVNQLLLWYNVNKYVKFVKVSIPDVLSHLKGCAILFLPVVLIRIYRITGTFLLGNFATMEEVGFFTYADKITEMPFHIITAIGIVMLPRTTNLVAKGEHEKSLQYIKSSMRYNSIFACAVCFGMIAVSGDFCVLFLGKEFFVCAGLMCVIAPTLIMRAWANVARTQYLMPNHHDKEYVISLVVGVIVNITLNTILISRLGALGAAYATLGAESSVAITQILFTRKALPLKQYILPNIPFVFIGLIMMCGVAIVAQQFPHNWYGLGVQIIVGAIIYFIFTLLYLLRLKDPITKKLFVFKRKQ